jgi:hypothetical protein
VNVYVGSTVSAVGSTCAMLAGGHVPNCTVDDAAMVPAPVPPGCHELKAGDLVADDADGAALTQGHPRVRGYPSALEAELVRPERLADDAVHSRGDLGSRQKGR